RSAAAVPFDLAGEWPVRAALYQIDGTTHVLLLVLHHVAADGWSLGPLWRDLATAYAARTRGAAHAWPPLAVQFADYAIWQRQLLGDTDAATSVGSAQLAYWRRQLEGMPTALTLPTTARRRTCTEADPPSGAI